MPETIPSAAQPGGQGLTPVLSAFWDDPQSWTLATYLRHGGYEALRAALRMQPEDVITAVKDSGLRGRGGAGFPTGLKWGFLPKPDGQPRYLVVNADESEPGTCKDIPLIDRKSTRLNSSHANISYAVFCLKKKKNQKKNTCMMKLT